MSETQNLLRSLRETGAAPDYVVTVDASHSKRLKDLLRQMAIDYSAEGSSFTLFHAGPDDLEEITDQLKEWKVQYKVKQA